jgi:hypothetical protein
MRSVAGQLGDSLLHDLATMSQRSYFPVGKHAPVPVTVV